MAIIGISDVHLQRPGPANDFHAHAALAAFLLKNREHTIISVGDLVDCWQDNPAAVEAYPANALLCQVIEECIDLCVSGNHDSSLERFCNVEYVESPFLYKRVLFMHGHEFDWFNHGIGMPVGWAASAFAGLCERVIHRDADVWLADKARRLLKVGRYGSPLQYTDAALAHLYRARHSGATALAIVLGHTHCHIGFSGYYGNCGHWTGLTAGQRMDHVFIDR